MFLADRNTDRRGRPRARARSRRRPRSARFLVMSRGERAILLLLAFLTPHGLAAVADTLALIGLGGTNLADLGRDLAHELLVDTGDLDFDRARHREADAGRGRNVHLVREAELHAQRLAFHRRAV